jgi:hypothetical protein
MSRSAVTALGAAMMMFCAPCAAQAAFIDFGIAVFGPAPTYTGTSLDQSTAFDFGDAKLLVSEVAHGDSSGLTKEVDFVNIAPPEIDYGSGDGPTALPGLGVAKTWTGKTGDLFTETLTTVESINRLTPNAITVTLSGTASDADGVFTDVPVFLILSASQAGGPKGAVLALMTDTTIIGGVPESSTWAMMALGFSALGYATIRRRKMNISALSA